MNIWTKGKPRGHRAPVIDRILAKVVEDKAGCWVWQGGTNGVGYGVIGSGGKTGRHTYVHRTTYVYFIGEIPDGLVIDHLCRNRGCCNPWHLQPVTHRVNLLRGVGVSARAAAALACPKGHPYDEANTYRNPNTGHRSCRACARAYQRELRARRRAA